MRGRGTRARQPTIRTRCEPRQQETQPSRVPRSTDRAQPFARLREIAGGEDESFINEMVLMFIEQASTIIPALRTAVEVDDTENVKKLAHKLKGISSNIGTTGIAKTCKELECLAGSAGSDGEINLVNLLESEFQLVREALESLVGASERDLDEVETCVC